MLAVILTVFLIHQQAVAVVLVQQEVMQLAQVLLLLRLEMAVMV